ncbi:MAG: hypothetical protein H7333_06630, partial [Bdellovibrionales bacterium]|nr:hypothetical protein [Oligoflexia bacterium]
MTHTPRPAQASQQYITLSLHDGESVSGVLTLPLAPIAVVLILQGSGNVAENGDVSSPFLGQARTGMKAEPSVQVAEALASVGIASFRYAKRGCEKSEQLKNQVIPHLRKDAKSAFQFLKTKFPELKAGIAGFSEGAILALLVAQEAKIDFLCLLGLPTREIDEILAYQFLSWPIELLFKKLKVSESGMLDPSVLPALEKDLLPLGQGTWADHLAKNHQLSITSHLLPVYRQLHAGVQALIAKDYGDWYQSMKELEPMAKI